MRSFTKIFLLVTVMLFAGATQVYARTELRCRRFLFFEFSCQEVEVNYALTKQIRLSGQNDFTNKLDPVLNAQEMVFRIEVQNNGQATDDNLKIIDTLPQNLSFVSSENLVRGETEDRKVGAEIDGELKPNETQTFTYVARANIEGISEGEKRCVTNNATLYRDENSDNEAQEEEIEASDNSTICILNGTPEENGFGNANGDSDTNGADNNGNGTTELPNSAAGGLGIILSSLAALGSGVVISRRINF